MAKNSATATPPTPTGENQATPPSPPPVPVAAKSAAWESCSLGDMVYVFNNDGRLWPVPARPGIIVGLGLERGTVHVDVCRHPDLPDVPPDSLRGMRLIDPPTLPRFRDDKSILGDMPPGVFAVLTDRFDAATRFPELPLGDSGNKRPFRAR